MMRFHSPPPLQLLDRLFLTPEEDFLDCGIMTVQLYKDGEWVPVTFDTRVPYGDLSSQIFNCPVYARCADLSEQWVMMLEKAFAKLHGNYVRVASCAVVLGGKRAVSSPSPSSPSLPSAIPGGRLRVRSLGGPHWRRGAEDYPDRRAGEGDGHLWQAVVGAEEVRAALLFLFLCTAAAIAMLALPPCAGTCRRAPWLAAP